MKDKNRSSSMPFDPTPLGKHVLPTRKEPLSDLEASIMNPLDVDKLSDLAEVLYAFNNYKVGPMSGFFVAVEITPGKKWCVGQLCADRAKPLKLFEKKQYKTAKGAQRAAEKMRIAALDTATTTADKS